MTALPAPSKFSDLRLRTLSSLVLIAAVVGLLCLGHLWLLGAHVLVVFPLMIWEAVSLIRRWWPARRPRQRLAMVSAVVIVLGSFIASVSWLLSDNRNWLGYLIILVFIILNDIGCYLGGRLIGGRKLAPSISPGKTISGSLFGIATGIFPMLLWFFIGIGSLQQYDLFTVLISLLIMVSLGGFWPLLAQASDLLESYFKRLCGAKDSSHLIPGHGGVLDRLDSQLLTMPAAALFTYFARDIIV
ncbi:MAG: hypothetical protein FJX22_02295 [Alphaproteobacteria bacterium]|nr:hypothetical protein [Alphaproteobacteria bacterium]